MSDIAMLKHTFLMQMALNVNANQAHVIGTIGRYNRMIATISGGSFSGPYLNGHVLPGGADWVLMGSDGSMEIDVRTTLQTDDGALIYLQYKGRFRASAKAREKLNNGLSLADDEYSLAVTAAFETGYDRYHWLNDAIVVGTGVQQGFNPTYSFFTVG